MRIALTLDNSELIIYNTLKDNTRLKIITYLVVYQQLTLKELSEMIQKGKTTIHHHIKILEKLQLVKYFKKEDDYKSIKTRYYFLNPENEFIAKLRQQQYGKERIPSTTSFDIIKTQAHLLTTWIEWFIDFLASHQESASTNNNFETYILPQDDETLRIIHEFKAKLEQKTIKIQLAELTNSKNLISIVDIPIKKILDRRRT